jgi:mono/diheme cytochrome c family protein
MARAIVVVVALGLGLSGTYVAAQQAQQQPQIKKGVVKPTPADDGQLMFQEYCTACHGKAGKGDGPAVPALKKAPADLTTLSARNGGVFPAVKVSRYIDGADELAAHGSRDMPVWGPVFRSLAGGTGTEALRVRNLTDFVKSIQK